MWDCAEFCSVVFAIKLFFYFFGLVFLIVGTIVNLFKRIVEFFCVYIFFWRLDLYFWIVYLKEIKKKKKEMVIEFGVDVVIDIGFY